jgi:hypothetical protein
VIWPIILTIVVLIVAIVPAVNSYRAKIHARGVR